MFEDAFAPMPSRSSEFPVMPAIDVKEDEKNLMVTAELPGVDKKDLKIEVRDNILTVQGEKRSEKREDKDNYHCVERSYGGFMRRVMLPCEVDDTQAEASMDKGVLTLKLPKAKGSSAKTIQVK